MYSKLLIRYGELSTKGKNKMTFVRKLAKNVELLVGEKPEFIFDRMYLSYSESNINKLKKVFGIQSYSPVIVVNTNIKKIEEAILKEIKQYQKGTFKVKVSRHWKNFDMTSMELARYLGGIILNNSSLEVKMKNQDFSIEVEIRENQSFIFSKRINGLGGYPVGINGKVLHLISGGIDSPVAALEMMKRGIHVDFLNFITPPTTDQKTIDKVNEIIRLLISYQGSTKLYQSNYTKIMMSIAKVSNISYRITLMRRSFYRIASILGKSNNYLGLSNGENIGQVASQTLESMRVIQDQSDFPIYRPILTADKQETIVKAIKFKTYEISIIPADETCEMFAPKRPVIKPTIKDAEKYEEELNGLFELEKENIKSDIIVKKMALNE